MIAIVATYPERAARALVASLLLVACAGSQPAEDRSATLRELHAEVQRVACLRSGTSTTCDPDLRVTYEAREDSSWAINETWVHARKRGTIWCEAGQPRGRFSSFLAPNDEIERDVPQPVWEAIWRVLDVTSGCVSTYGAAVKVTRSGETRACADPRFDMHELFETAYWTASHGRPARPWAPVAVADEGHDGICSIDPTACPVLPSPSKCPPFRGPLWPATAARANAEGDGEGGEGDEREGRDAGRDSPPNQPNQPKPKQADIVDALSKLLPEARRCMHAGDAIARASISFRPDGSVARVEVKGSAAGKPSEACIRRALEKARVPSFPGALYTVHVTIRSAE